MNVPNVIFKTEEAANDVLDGLKGILKQKGKVSDEDLNDLCGLPSTYQSHRWIWDDLSGFEIFKLENDSGDWCLAVSQPKENEVNQ